MGMPILPSVREDDSRRPAGDLEIVLPFGFPGAEVGIAAGQHEIEGADGKRHGGPLRQERHAARRHKAVTVRVNGERMAMSRKSIRQAVTLIAFGLLFTSITSMAHAQVFDTQALGQEVLWSDFFGADARAIGMGNTGLALGHDGSALIYKFW